MAEHHRPHLAGRIRAGVGDDHHASNLELFVDLVFVFAVTQLTALYATNPSIDGFGRGLLLSLMVWWAWGQLTWLGNAVDLEQQAAKVVVLCTILPAILMAATIPSAFEGTGLWFALSYAVVAFVALGLQGVALLPDSVTRAAWFAYAIPALIGQGVFIAGGFADVRWRPWVWLAGVGIYVAGALLTGRAAAEGQAEWHISPRHFAERHALFVIIALGESIVAVGVTISGIDITIAVAVATASAVAVAASFWWAYFGFEAAAVERSLANADVIERGKLARDLFTFGHFPIVVGIVLFAVVAKHVVAHPSDGLHTPDQIYLALSVLFFVGGFTANHFRAVRGLAPERLVVIALVAALSLGLGGHLPAPIVLFAVAALIAGMHTITSQRVQHARLATAHADERPG